MKQFGSGVDLERSIKHVDDDFFDSIFVGPIHPIKRPLDIVNAFAMVKDKIPNIRLHFVGDVIFNNLKKEMEEIASGNNIDITFYGSISDEKLYELYDIADISIFVPESEPWGIFPLETIIGGIPTIISDQCGAISALPDDYFVVPTGSITEIAKNILEIYNQYDRSLEKTANIGKCIVKDYSWSNYSKKMEEIFRKSL